jgi:hypothetical protein
MSRVTNAIITANINGHPEGEIDSVNKFLRQMGVGGGEFREVTEHAGGTKHMECRVYLSAFNYADTDAIVRAVDQAPWEDKKAVQLFVKEQEQEVFLLLFGDSSAKPGAVEFTRRELLIINNALNEVCNGFALEGEFDTRMGCKVEEARALLARFHSLVSS